ncbi:hypothetical protein D6D02_06471 [Aureobasidium pullulans]|nr:hypothetical protein D6D23_08864 [Aureobasidium pullulans]THY10351.1 hypothetical protein D6D02_06471 [Aureobasidium pullulans]THY49354.1 hypothetical protein D6C98_06392 [Aureobasidium pullulans]THZ94630.1 hypothetical protein D6C82_08185 [Aureobasidium pullulans]TIA21429.1 hypothetical protein D6C81_03799 [Aureobasidium pullulans]
MDAFNTWLRERMSSRGNLNHMFNTSKFGSNHVETLNGWQSFCNNTTVWQRFKQGDYYAIECGNPHICRLARQAADERNARMDGDEKFGEYTDALAELMRYNDEKDRRKEEMDKLRDEADKNAEAARKEAAQKGLATKKRNKERRDEQQRLTEHICAELEGLKGQDEQKNELLAGLQRDVLRVHKKEKEKIAKKNQLVSRICDALDDLKDLDEKNKERFERIQQEILDITSEDEQNEEGEQAGAKRQKTG